MGGETDLDRLIQSMSAELAEGVFAFATFPDRVVPTGLSPVMLFQEAEGTTVILQRVEADAYGIAYDYPCRMITLQIHSALEAVGFLARITSALAAASLSVNPVSAFYHDHLFVPEDRADKAMEVLAAMAGP